MSPPGVVGIPLPQKKNLRENSRRERVKEEEMTKNVKTWFSYYLYLDTDLDAARELNGKQILRFRFNFSMHIVLLMNF